MENIKPKPWERQIINGKKETNKAFEAFQIYRDLGVNRSQQNVALALNKNLRQIAVWASQWNWTQRIQAWEDELDKRRRDATFKEIEKMRARHAKHAQSIENSLMIPVQAFLNKIKTHQQTGRTNEFDNLDEKSLFNYIKDIASVINKVIDIERKSRGEPTEINKNVNTNNIDLSSLTEEQLERIINTGKL